MLIVDDPLLACIMRFVTDSDASDAENRQFLQMQIQTLKQYLLRFPEEEQGERAMEWVAQHAENYRRDWQRRSVSRQTYYLRCTDCPLRYLGASRFCEIHEQWLYLVRQYMLGETRSRDYVEQSLGLLGQHKESLRLRRVLSQADVVAPAARKKKKQKKKKKKKRKAGNGGSGARA